MGCSNSNPNASGEASGENGKRCCYSHADAARNVIDERRKLTRFATDVSETVGTPKVALVTAARSSTKKPVAATGCCCGLWFCWPRTAREKPKLESKPRREPFSECCTDESRASRHHLPGDDWLNSVVRHMWPTLSAYLTDVIIRHTEPALNEFPWPLRSAKFERERCHLGHIPIHVTDVSTAKLDQMTRTGEFHNLMIALELDWSGDSSLYIRASGAGFGICKVMLKGTLHLELVGMIAELPLFKGFRVFFQKTPEVDVEFQGMTAPLQIVRKKLSHLLASSLNDVMVLPNRCGWDWAEDVDILLIKRPCSEGILWLTLVKADDLPAMDFTMVGPPSSDPYAVLKCGAVRFQTSTHYKNLAPRFNKRFGLPIANSAQQQICVEIHDEDQMKEDDFIGSWEEDVSTIINEWRPKTKTVLLSDHTANRHHENTATAVGDTAAGNGKCRGRLTVKAEWTPVVMSKTWKANDVGAGLLYVGIYSATGHVSTDDEGSRADSQYFVKLQCRPGVIPDTGPDVLETWRRPPDELDKDQAQKLALLRKHNVPAEDQAEILGIDIEQMHHLLRMRGYVDSCDITWEQGFEFYVSEAQKAEVVIEIFQEIAHKIRRLGQCRRVVKDVLARDFLNDAATERFGAMTLKFRMQFRPFASVPEALKTQRSERGHNR